MSEYVCQFKDYPGECQKVALLRRDSGTFMGIRHDDIIKAHNTINMAGSKRAIIEAIRDGSRLFRLEIAGSFVVPHGSKPSTDDDLQDDLL